MGRSKSEMHDPHVGYTDDFFMLNEDIRINVRFLRLLVKLDLMHFRVAQILAANYSQKRFEELRDASI